MAVINFITFTSEAAAIAYRDAVDLAARRAGNAGIAARDDARAKAFGR